ncbi:MAG: ABC transporter substrate-binding protein [Anaerolineaceae bacterium]|nr:ABC transporter substrate-binding protein [Anaerolineaceae bacterium]MCY4010437.1 ABC transporter substrate-binding protein [Anaerolineaceae bacterium]
MSRRILFCWLVVALLLVTLVPATAQEGTVLRRHLPTDIDHWNPVTQTLVVAWIAQNHVLPPMYVADPHSGDPINGGPSLLSWEISDDGLEYTFTIRDDAFWSDGVPISSHDVKWTYEAVLSEHVTTTRASWMDNVDVINIIDDRTFQFIYKELDCNPWPRLTIKPLPSHLFAADYTDFNDNPYNQFPSVSGGAYILEEWERDSHIRFRVNPDYYNGPAKVETMLLQIITDDTVARQAMAAGELDYMGITPTFIYEFADNPNVNVVSNPLNSWFVLIMNHADPENPMPGLDEDGNYNDQPPHSIFGELAVRQAVAMGWDKNDAIIIRGEGILNRIVGPLTPSIPWSYDDNVTPWEYDPEGAKAILEEAGWVDEDGDGIREKDGQTLSFHLDAASSSGYPETAAIIQDQLGEIGFDISVSTQDFASLASEKLYPQIFDAFLVSFTWSQPAPHILTEILLGAANDTLEGGLGFTSYTNPELDALITAAAENCDQASRAANYSAIQQMVKDEVIADFISDNASVTVHNVNLTNLNLGSWGSNPIEDWEFTGN